MRLLLLELDDLAKIQRPESKTVDLESHDLAQGDLSLGIRYPSPAQIELLPCLKLLNGEFESWPALSQSCPQSVVTKSWALPVAQPRRTGKMLHDL